MVKIKKIKQKRQVSSDSKMKFIDSIFVLSARYVRNGQKIPWHKIYNKKDTIQHLHYDRRTD